MRHKNHIRVLALVPFLLLPLYAQERKEEPAAKELPAPTNLKVLKVKTGAEVAQIMRTFTAGLGVQCDHCHVADNFASDENPNKEAARRMIKLTQKINEDFPDRKLRVSCYTCHRAETVPKTVPAQ